MGFSLSKLVKKITPMTGIKSIDHFGKKLAQGTAIITGEKDPYKAPSAGLTPLTPEQVGYDLARSERAKDLAEGRARGEELFKEGALGRVDEAVMAARKQQAEQGFTDQENSALRDNQMAARQALGADARSQKIMLAAQGIRGGRAAALGSKLAAEQGAQAVNSERELFLKRLDAKRGGLDKLDEAQRYNIDQKNKELTGKLTTEMGYGSLGAADRGQSQMASVGAQQAQAMALSANKKGGKK